MNKSTSHVIGLGDTSFRFAVYIANQPAMPEYASLHQIVSLQNGDIADIGTACGNGWRKVFNVYAKLLYALNKEDFDFSLLAPTWQQYRDQFLLQQGSGTALVFSPPQLRFQSSSTALITSASLMNTSLISKDETQVEKSRLDNTVHIICGRTFAKALIEKGVLNTELTWLDAEFAIDLRQRVIVCPYFDYRQLSNNKIERLSVMLSNLVKGNI